MTIDDIYPTREDLEERIKINLEKDNLTLEQIKEDTFNLVQDIEKTILRCQLQLRIYKDLDNLCDQKILEKQKSLIVLPERV